MADASSPSFADAASSGVAERSDVFEGLGGDEPDGPDPTRARRIAYFMLFRLAMLAAFTVLAAAVTWASRGVTDTLFTGFVWGSLSAGYAATIVFARWLKRARDFDRLVWAQTSFDILAAAIVVQMTGGVDSGFAFMWIIAVLGAAIMGGPRLTWAAAVSCIAIWVVSSTLQFLGLVEPIVLGAPPAPLPPTQHWLTVGRTVAAIAGVTVLSSYLNVQLASSASQLVDLRALNEHIVRSLGSGLWSCDPGGRLVYFNPAAGDILALSDADLGQPIDRVLPGLSEVPGPADAEVPRGELTITTRAGKRLHVGLSRTPLLDGRGRSIGDLVIFQDLTRLHELTEKVRRNERLAALGGMAASVAHEIRNPLAAISGSAELLSSLELEADDQRLLSIIRRESTRLSDLVTDLLAFTRPREPQTSVVDLSRLARETCEAFSADPANAGIDVEVAASDEDVKAQVDAVQLSQVLWNLLRNASEAMHGRGRVRVRVSRPKERAQLSVTDDGPGIDDALRERVFDPFFTTKDHGTGFGLAIAHRIVGDNGGTLELDARVRSGARFVIRFPLVA